MYQRAIRSRTVQTAAMAVTTSVIVTSAVSGHQEEKETLRMQQHQKRSEEDQIRSPLRWPIQHSIALSRCEALSDSSSPKSPSFLARRLQTLRRIRQVETKNATLESKYKVAKKPLGEGAFGQVFLGKNRLTGEQVAIKKIWKEFTKREDCQREMNALLHIRAHGGHPHICSMKENFDEKEHFALVLDLINGGELFDHLVENGAYSELDASRLIREAVSAIDFLHGIGIVHGDVSART